MKKALAVPSREPIPFPLRRAKWEVEENKLREEVWLQRLRNQATRVRASKPRSSFISQDTEQHFVVIEEANLPSEMRRVIVPSEQQARHATTQP